MSVNCFESLAYRLATLAKWAMGQFRVDGGKRFENTRTGLMQTGQIEPCQRIDRVRSCVTDGNECSQTLQVPLSLSSLPPVHQSTQLPFPLCSPTFSLTPPPPHIGFFSFCLSYMYLYSRLLLLYSPSLWTKKYKRGEKTLTSIGKHKSSWRIHIFSSSAQQPMFSLSWRLPSFSGLDSLWKKKKKWGKRKTYYENMDRGTHGCRDTVRRRK